MNTETTAEEILVVRAIRDKSLTDYAARPVKEKT